MVLGNNPIQCNKNPYLNAYSQKPIPSIQVGANASPENAYQNLGGVILRISDEGRAMLNAIAASEYAYRTFLTQEQWAEKMIGARERAEEYFAAQREICIRVGSVFIWSLLGSGMGGLTNRQLIDVSYGLFSAASTYQHSDADATAEQRAMLRESARRMALYLAQNHLSNDAGQRLMDEIDAMIEDDMARERGIPPRGFYQWNLRDTSPEENMVEINSFVSLAMHMGFPPGVGNDKSDENWNQMEFILLGEHGRATANRLGAELYTLARHARLEQHLVQSILRENQRHEPQRVAIQRDMAATSERFDLQISNDEFSAAREWKIQMHSHLVGAD
ncbi:MAG: hypothetical protein FWB71_01650 [Defluviitaleaceae bacterium]|nr:hypothetical protein [Defluviitaleaceae bacterium]